jgi:hydrogenase maturation protease
MNQHLIDTVVHAVLYEGHILHPSRGLAKRSERGSTCGRVFPEVCAGQKASDNAMQTECLVEGTTSTRVEIIARFLQPMERDLGALAAPLREMPALNNPDFFHMVPVLEVDGQQYQSRQEAVERVVPMPTWTLGELCAQPQMMPFSFAPTRSIEPVLDSREHIAGVVVRRQEAVEGVVEISAQLVGESLVKISVRLVNRSRLPVDFLDAEEVALRTLVATHVIFHAHDGEFVSLIDPPEAFAAAAATCRNLGTWPVLIGDEQKAERDTLLSSPIILCDYPSFVPDELFAPSEIEEGLAVASA